MKENKNLVTNKSGQAHIIILAIFTVIMGFALLVIGPYLYFAIATGADAGTKTVPGSGAAAVGLYTFGTGNVSNGELVNITNGAAVYRFEFNTTNNGSTSTCVTANCIVVNLTGVAKVLYNQSVWASGNLTAAINANASTSALVTAANTTNLTTLTAVTRGTAGNNIVLASNAANIVVTTMAGGVDIISGQAAQNSLNNYVSITFPLFGLALMVLGFGVIFITIKKSFGNEVR